MLAYLESLFQNSLSDQTLLESIELSKRQGLMAFLRDKLNVEVSSMSVSPVQKRNEEYLKYVVKRAFKYLFQKFMKGRNKLSKSEKLEKW